VFVTQLALEYRMQYHKDVVIDLVCYRRHGHNEADEPAATQPLMYKTIRGLRTTREKYAERLLDEGVVSENKIVDMVKSSRNRLEEGHPVVPHLLDSGSLEKPHQIDWHRFVGGKWDAPVDTFITLEDFQRLGRAAARAPTGFELHSRVARILEDRRKMVAGEMPADWGFGEMLAYASLLDEGFAVRLAGQDSERGTFFHRHAVLHDQESGAMYTPLQHLSAGQAPFLVINSLLSEEAVLAFEYGYSTTEPDTLTIWEAQFGDFANGAQVVIDQFISSGEQKWGRMSGLVMFCPHGFEGMGPEHSSARLERYLQLCAQYNIQVCVPTTPAQTFHMLRRQLLRPYRKPLIVMSPKSLLRHPLAISDVEAFTQGGFLPVIDEVDPLDRAKVTRLVMCSGKVYYDLLEARRAHELEHVAVVRIEQLYPFPANALDAVVKQYPNVDHFVWCQEEPRNQGAWFAQRHYFRRVLGGYARLELASRLASAAPAAGSLKAHQLQQQEVVAKGLGLIPIHRD
jgi:2-oxoglutarate dehydrogenase E1 component